MQLLRSQMFENKGNIRQTLHVVNGLIGCPLRAEASAEVTAAIRVWVLYEGSHSVCKVFLCHTLVSQLLPDTSHVARIRIAMPVTHTQEN